MRAMIIVPQINTTPPITNKRMKLMLMDLTVDGIGRAVATPGVVEEESVNVIIPA